MPNERVQVDLRARYPLSANLRPPLDLESPGLTEEQEAKSKQALSNQPTCEHTWWLQKEGP